MILENQKKIERYWAKKENEFLYKPVFIWCSGVDQIRTVASSDADAKSNGNVGCHETQLTVRVWPENTIIGRSCRRCHK